MSLTINFEFDILKSKKIGADLQDELTKLVIPGIKVVKNAIKPKSISKMT